MRKLTKGPNIMKLRPKYREDAGTRKSQILAAAYNIAKEQGLARVSQSAVARRLMISRPLVISHFKAEDLTSAVVSQALSEGNLPIIAEGIAARVPEAIGAPASVKLAAVNSFLQ